LPFIAISCHFEDYEEMATNGKKLQEMAKNGKWQEMAGNSKK
jgi:hypothetical protein